MPKKKDFYIAKNKKKIFFFFAFFFWKGERHSSKFEVPSPKKKKLRTGQEDRGKRKKIKDFYWLR